MHKILLKDHTLIEIAMHMDTFLGTLVSFHHETSYFIEVMRPLYCSLGISYSILLNSSPSGLGGWPGLLNSE